MTDGHCFDEHVEGHVPLTPARPSLHSLRGTGTGTSVSRPPAPVKTLTRSRGAGDLCAHEQQSEREGRACHQRIAFLPFCANDHYPGDNSHTPNVIERVPLAP